jgi:hypothetical protein
MRAASGEAFCGDALCKEGHHPAPPVCPGAPSEERVGGRDALAGTDNGWGGVDMGAAAGGDRLVSISAFLEDIECTFITRYV